MSISKRFIGYAFVFVGCLLLAVFLAWKPGTNSSVQPVELLINFGDMPEGWVLEDPPHAYPERLAHKEGVDARAGVQFTAPGVSSYGNAGHRVGRYSNGFWAMVAFYTDPYLRTSGRVISKGELQGWEYHSGIADRFRWYCADLESIYGGSPMIRMCHATGQYDQFISEFGTPIDDKYMTLEDFARILKAIDERMAKGLGKPLPGTTDSTTTPAVR